jgi:hypothetical protein
MCADSQLSLAHGACVHAPCREAPVAPLAVLPTPRAPTALRVPLDPPRAASRSRFSCSTRSRSSLSFLSRSACARCSFSLCNASVRSSSSRRARSTASARSRSIFSLSWVQNAQQIKKSSVALVLTASAPCHPSSNISRATSSDLYSISMYLLSNASVCAS